MIEALLGLAFGFVGSIPVAGPISILVVEGALAGRLREVRALAAGASVAEALYAGGAYAGLSALLVRFPRLEPVSQAIGALSLLVLGLYFALRKPAASGAPAAPQAARPGGAARNGFLITLFNPTLLGTWSAATTALHATGWVTPTPLAAVPFALGAGVGIALWFVLLIAVIARVRDHFHKETLDRAVRAVGVLLAVLGLVLAGRVALALVG
jgi:threonine/homoserine/homoserine lactone efflux protein